jgi:cell division topological specificity factor MinE
VEFLLRIPFLQRLFGHHRQALDESRQAARDRLKNALVGDRCTVAPGLSAAIQKDLLEVLGRYMEVDGSTLNLRLEPKGEEMQWTAGVKVVRVHRQAHLPEAALRDSSSRKSRPKRTLRGVRWRRSQEDDPAAPSAEEKSA